jgi:hypothetical protein
MDGVLLVSGTREGGDGNYIPTSIHGRAIEPSPSALIIGS